MNSVFPRVYSTNIPFVSAKEMIMVDYLMINNYNISLLQMMENAGLNLARTLNKLYPKTNQVIILAGQGNNGGGGLNAARRLHNWGYNITVMLPVSQESLKESTLHQLKTLKQLKIPIKEIKELEDLPDIKQTDEYSIIDSLLGYSLKGQPRENYALLIKWANKTNIKIISLDLPSGISATTGEVFTPTIEADYTLTLALPKSVFQKTKVKEKIGKLLLADISVPYNLYEEMGLKVEKNLFRSSSIVEVKF